MSKVKVGKIHDSNQKKYLFSLIISFIIGAIILSALTSVCCVLLVKGIVNVKSAPILFIIICSVSVFIASVIGTHGIKSKGWLAGIIITLPILLSVYIGLFAANSWNLNLKSLIIIPVTLIAGATGGILSVNKKKVNI